MGPGAALVQAAEVATVADSLLLRQPVVDVRFQPSFPAPPRRR